MITGTLLIATVFVGYVAYRIGRRHASLGAQAKGFKAGYGFGYDDGYETCLTDRQRVSH